MKSNEMNALEASAQTRDMKELASRTGNLYRSLAMISKRSNQITGELREELHSKLNEFATTTDNLEEVFENREQIEISKYYEKLPNPAVLAYHEFINGDIYYREPEKDDHQFSDRVR